MKLLVQLIALALLAGCETTPSKPDPVIITQEVEVPVPVDCKIDWPAKPLDLSRAPPPKTLYQSGQRILQDLESHRGYSKELEAALAKCAPSAVTSPVK